MTTYWSLSAALDPWCMVLPRTVNDVSMTITTLADNECPFGIRGGGHGAHALSNSVEDGVTLDMGLFNTTTYNTDTKIASIGPGAHWGSVYDTLTPYGVTVTGGRAAYVGVGGFLLGGGNSYHSGSHGFGCDQVQSFEIVLADGQVVNANKYENSDLWKALRGGSGNFGLVTRFDLYAIEFEDPSNPYIWGGIVGYNYTQSDAVIDAFINFTNNVDKDIYSSSIAIWGYSASGFSVRSILDNVANRAYPPAFDKYLSIGSQTSNSLRSETMSNITAELIRDHRTRTIWFTGTYANDPRILRFITAKHDKLMLTLESILGPDSGVFSSCQAQPMTEPMISQGKGNNVLGLETRIAATGGPGFMFLIYIGIESAEHEALALPYVESFWQDVEEYADSLDGNWRWRYLNYAYRTQEPISGYGVENVKWLREAAQKYDPKGVFQRLRSSGFKIPQYIPP
ncbi:hypothetical protein PFICI_05825 [Pestalotiopsis fici W106-1]|uniref:FAD-binding PCMH-type domain-containing protein n=1 Tax=Pestalotiopsis fici (strain W106-1 / CGMCC3.15140) TaxID=1229662 RepID=W3XD58_PESFW|nr:uncharacterized protein PFICI_05825 [Pestalotiopsis fici W106-1]ETS83949.1 hypothetical protein PFICI_05825 [Pestalotiopsis fici W106-1]